MGGAQETGGAPARRDVPGEGVPPRPSALDRTIRFCIENKLVVVLALGAVVAWGILSAPFDWRIEGVERDPVPVDAIPDIGENQQIVFTDRTSRTRSPTRLRRRSKACRR